MENPQWMNQQTPEEVKALGWKAECRDSDGHLTRMQAPFQDDEDIVSFVREAMLHGETITIWPHEIKEPTGFADLAEYLNET